MDGRELIRLTAREAVALLARGEVTPLDLVDAALARIEATDAALAAVPTLCADRARRRAREIMAAGDGGAAAGGAWLAGLPVVIKDLTDVAGVRTTYGSTIFADHVPETSDILVERLERNGAIVLGKSNTPEFGAGANTFNEVFGKSRNPWNTALACGGSSGGSAVALAVGQSWLATGSDLGGSLRIPASFCSVVGLRPSPGRVARSGTMLPFDTLGVAGPMARNVGDLALMLDAMAGADRRDPLALPAPARPFLASAVAPTPAARIAYGAGAFPVEPEVDAICRAAAFGFADLGARVEEAAPDLADAPEIFQTLRAARYAAAMGPLLEDHREALKPEIVWNIEKGQALSADDIGRAERARGALCGRMADFQGEYDLLTTPAVIVPPFDVDVRYVEEAAGRKFVNYVDWMMITYAITLTGCPAMSIPCGFTEDGLPVGLQIVGRPRGEAELIAAAGAFEQRLGLAGRVPIDPMTPPRVTGC